jgi:phospholipid/cholesterol/gamma-HCH transport system permease protein
MTIPEPLLRRLAFVGEWAYFLFRGFAAIPRILVIPSLWIRALHGTLMGAFPLAVVAGFALGAVIWLHTREVLARTGSGAVEYLPTLLGAAVLMELGPIAAGLILAARSGASLGAELASMKLGEQIDALELLAVSSISRLVAPRTLACVLAAPLLHILIAALALGSGFLAEVATGSTSLLKYQTAVLRELRVADVLPAGLKTLAFGFLIGGTGCFVGLRAEGGSEGVGRAATQSVVYCSLLVLLADVLLVGLIQALFG